MAPACPILLPGGAVSPAINETTGLFSGLFRLIQSAASSSASPPISPINTIPNIYIYIYIYTLSLRINHKLFKTINEISSIKWISANTNTSTLPKTNSSSLINSLISQSPRSTNNSNRPLLMYISRHNPYFTLSRFNYSRAIGSN